ncbi:Ogr/Delta-like zinc finger [compost metagenome]|jgi:hypothetical protein|nr:ogr/Delta-like zinc finger family protein [Aeromonas salmonicida]MDF2401642.1 transcriptional regulator [Aeromonas sp. 5HA1]RSM24743.1 transcriptional regulator [Aeromonas salmonicida]HDN9019348.1 ogr/Delta-like zinc finger family protein [Aeromonas salmonicida]HDX8380839.1 ogr/Delta-like zinc finger family protein [Aeromonas salmonicida]
MRVMCTECGQLGRITKTNRITAGVANLYCQCTDVNCGHSWVSTLAYSHTLSPSAKSASDMAISLVRGLSPEAHGTLSQSVTAHQQQLDMQAALEQTNSLTKPLVTRRAAQ